MYKRIRLFLAKKHTFSIVDMLMFVGNAVVLFIIIGAELTMQTMVAIQSIRLKPFQWGVIAFFSILSVAALSFREHLMLMRRRKLISGRVVITNLIGGIINRYREVRGKSKEERINYLKEVLRGIEKALEAILKDNGYHVGEIVANIMVIDINRTNLILKCFGTYTQGRKRITLPIKNHVGDVLPGAPSAYTYNEIIYINNTLDPKYQGFFKNDKPYRSIISIPVVSDPGNGYGEVVAVVNIDSTEPDQFVSTDFIAKRIYPDIQPFIMLLTLEIDVLLSEEGGAVRNASK